MSPEIKSLIFAILATLCIVAGAFLILSAISAKRHADMIHYHFDDNRIVIAKIIGVLALALGFFTWYLANKARPITFFPNKNSYFASKKKDTLVFNGNVYVLKDSVDSECRVQR